MAGTQTRKKAVRIDHQDLVEVMNGSPGVLVYRNPHTNATTRWGTYGEVQLMTVQELMVIRGTYPRFFQDQWLVVLDADIINYLKLDHFYKNLITPEELEKFFEKTPEEISEFLSNASNGAKMLIAGRARKLYESGELNDIHKIRAINTALGIHIADLD